MGLVPVSNTTQNSFGFGPSNLGAFQAVPGQQPAWQHQRLPTFAGDPPQSMVPSGVKPILPPDEQLATFVNINMGQEIVPGGFGLGGRIANNHIRQLMLYRYVTGQLN